MAVRTKTELAFTIGQDGSLDDCLYSRTFTEILDTLDRGMSGILTLAALEQNAALPFGDIAEGRLVYLEADGEIDVVFTGPAATSAVVTGVGGTYPTGFAGGETLVLEVDNGGSVTATFLVTDTSLADVVNRVNSALALNGQGAYASDSGGELRITSPTTGAASEVEIFAGSTALATLGLVAGVTNGTNAVPGTSDVDIRRPADPSGSTVAGLKAYFLGTVRCTAITVDNNSDFEVRVRYAIAGDLVTTP